MELWVLYFVDFRSYTPISSIWICFFSPNFPPQKKTKKKQRGGFPPTGYRIPNKKHHGVFLEVGPGYPFRKGVPAWRTIPVSKWLGSPPFISHEWPFGRGPTTRSLGDLRSPWTMVINHLPSGMILQVGLLHPTCSYL